MQGQDPQTRKDTRQAEFPDGIYRKPRTDSNERSNQQSDGLTNDKTPVLLRGRRRAPWPKVD